MSYRVGSPVPTDAGMGTSVAVWHRAMAAGRDLPTLPLALDAEAAVAIDLEATYREAARRVYLA